MMIYSLNPIKHFLLRHFWHFFARQCVEEVNRSRGRVRKGEPWIKVLLRVSVVGCALSLLTSATQESTCSSCNSTFNRQVK